MSCIFVYAVSGNLSMGVMEIDDNKPWHRICYILYFVYAVQELYQNGKQHYDHISCNLVMTIQT